MDEVLTSGQFTQSTFSRWLKDEKMVGVYRSLSNCIHSEMIWPFLVYCSAPVSLVEPLFCAQRLEEEMSESGKQASLLFFWLFELEMRNCETGQASVSGIKGRGENCSFFFSRLFLLAFVSIASYRKATFVIEPMEENLNLSGQLLIHE